MSTFLDSLVARAAETGRTLQPRLPSVYEPAPGRAALPLFAPPAEPDAEPDTSETAALPPDAITPSPTPPVATPAPESTGPETTAAIPPKQSQPPSIKPHRPRKAPRTEETAATPPLLQPEREDVPLPPVAKASTPEEERPERIVVEKRVEQRAVRVERGREKASEDRPEMPRRAGPPDGPSNELMAQIREELRSFLANLDQKEPVEAPDAGRPGLPPPDAEYTADKAGFQTHHDEQPLLSNRPAAPMLRPELNRQNGKRDDSTARGKRPETRQQPASRPEPKIQVMPPLLPESPPRQPAQAAVEPEQTIEVRIGRIEVRAAPPVEKRPRRKEKTAVMNLDDYLKQRNGQGKRR